MTIGDLIVRVGAQIDGFKSAMGEVSSASASTANKAEAAASKISQAFASLGLVAVGTAALAAANRFNEAFVQIQNSTGATGEKLDSLKDSFTSVYKQADESAGEVAQALSILSTRTGATGKDLEGLTLSLLDLSKTQRESATVLVPLITRAFGDWSIASDKQAGAMDYLRVVSQQTGVQVSRLSSEVVEAGAPLRQLGYNFEQAVALIGKFEKEGVNTELVLGGMKAALQKFAKEGVTDTAEAWRKFVSGVKDGSITLQEVMTEVGAKRGTDLFKAIEEGRFQIDEMTKSAKKLADEGGGNVDTFKEKWIKVGHEIEAVIAKHSDLIMAVGFGLPVLANLGKALAFTGITGAIGNIVTALRFGLVPALTAVELGVLGIIGLLPAIIEGFRAWANIQKDIKPLDTSRPEGALGDKFVFTGFGAVPNNATVPQRFETTGQSESRAAHRAANPSPKPNPTGGGGGGDVPSHQFTIAESLAFEKLQQSAANAKRTLADFLGGTANLAVVYSSEMQKAADATSGLFKGATLQDLQNLPGVFNAAAAALSSGFTPAMLDAANEQLRLARDVEIVEGAYHALGMKTPDDLRAVAKAAQENYEIVRSVAGDAAADTQIAWTKATLAQIELDYKLGDVDAELYAQRKKMAEDSLNTLEGKTKESTGRIKQYTWDASQEMQRAMGSAFEGTYRALAKSIVDWKDWGKNLKNVVLDLAENMLSIMLKAFVKPLEDEAVKLAGKLGGVLGGIFGGGGSAAASTATSAGGAAASGASSAAGGVASAVGSFANVFNMVTGAVSAIAGVVSAIGTLRLEGTMNAVEHNTRYLQIQFEKFAQVDEWDRETHQMLKLDDIWNEIRNVVTSVSRMGMPEFAAAAPGNVTINVYGASDTDEVVNRVAQHLKRNGVYV